MPSIPKGLSALVLYDVQRCINLTGLYLGIGKPNEDK